jgi:hypothetical protein
MPKKPLKRKSSSPLTKPDSDRAVRKKAQAKNVPRKTAKRTKAKKPRPTAIQVVAAALDDLKALQVNVFDVRHLTSVTDSMVVASGRSDRHVRAVADGVSEQAKIAGYVPLGVEG